MPIQPKFQLGRQERQYLADKQFTDREGPRALFSKTVQEMNLRY